MEYISVNFNFLFCRIQGLEEKNCANQFAGLEIFKNLFKQFGGHVEGKDPWPKLVSCEFLFQIFYRRK